MSLMDVFAFLFLYGDLIFLVVAPVVVAAAMGWFIVNQLGKVDFLRVDGPEAEDIAASGKEIFNEDWLEEHGFIYVGTFKAGVPSVITFLASWKQRGSHTYATVYQTYTTNLPTKTTIDITSTFGRGYSLTTAGTDEGPMFPICQGLYKQHFNTLDIRRLWQLHQDAEALVAPEDLSKLDPLETEDTIELMTDEVRHQVAQIKSIRLWPLHVPWWYFVNRKLHLDKTVAQRMRRDERERLGIE